MERVRCIYGVGAGQIEIERKGEQMYGKCIHILLIEQPTFPVL